MQAKGIPKQCHRPGGPLIYLGATLLAFINPFITMAVFAGLAAYWMLPGNMPSD